MADFDTGVTPVNTWPLWHSVQLLIIPVCFINVPEKVMKLLVEWQDSHDRLVGRWFDGFAIGEIPAKD